MYPCYRILSKMYVLLKMKQETSRGFPDQRGHFTLYPRLQNMELGGDAVVYISSLSYYVFFCEKIEKHCKGHEEK